MSSELWRDFEAAVACLTGLRLSMVPLNRERIARATLFFPVVGAALGSAVAGCALVLADVVSRSALSIMCILSLVALSRGLGLRGVGAVAGSARWDRAWQGRTASVAAVVVVLVGKGAMLAATAESLVGYAVFLAAVLGRWAPVVLAHGARPVKAEVSDPLAVGRVGSREFAWSSVIAIGISLAVADALGLVAVVAAALTSTGVRIWAYRYRQGMTAALLAASIELVEGAVLAVIAGVSALAGR